MARILPRQLESAPPRFGNPQVSQPAEPLVLVLHTRVTTNRSSERRGLVPRRPAEGHVIQTERCFAMARLEVGSRSSTSATPRLRRVCHNDAGVDREGLAPHDVLLHTALQCLEQLPQDVAVWETAVFFDDVE
jgi:hypothetical protein